LGSIRFVVSEKRVLKIFSHWVQFNFFLQALHSKILIWSIRGIFLQSLFPFVPIVSVEKM
jgi:hypothetical protein